MDTPAVLEVAPSRFGVDRGPHTCRGRAWLAWAWPPRHAGILPTAPLEARDVDELARVVLPGLVRLPERPRVVVDARDLRFEGNAEPIVGALTERMPAAATFLAMERFAAVTCAGWMELLWHGLIRVHVERAAPCYVTLSPEDAWDWVEAPSALRAWVGALVRRSGRVPYACHAGLEVILRRDPAVDVAEAARKLGRSVRSLQRDLSAAGTRFEAVRDEARLARGEELLLGGSRSLDAIATTLGFASQSSFARWYRRRTGFTPTERRARARSGSMQHDE